jgi:hypothetical protein
MSDFIIEIIEPIINTIEIETLVSDTVTDNITIETQASNIVEIVNTEKLLASDMPYGYLISDTIGDLPASRISGLSEVIQNSSPNSIDGGSP